MNKIKIVSFQSARRFLLAFSGLVVLVVSLLSVLPMPLASAAIVTPDKAAGKAKIYCELPRWNYSKTATSLDGSESQVQACETGYTAAELGQQVDYNNVCNAALMSDPAVKSACVAGFEQGVQEFVKDTSKDKPAISSADASKRAKAYCELPEWKYSKSDIAACESAYTTSIKGGVKTNADAYCKKYSGNNQKACNAAFLQGQREYQKDHGVANPSTPADTKQQGTQDLQCESGNPLGWIQCIVIEQLGKMIKWVDGMITDQLALGTSGSSDQPNAIFTDNSGHCSASNNACDNYRQAWASFRNIALGLLVIAGLFIVISQALGAEILDAYTVRKTLPRLLIAALGITLSWPLMQFLITLSNDLGFGVRYLIEAPFPKAVLHINFGDSLLAGGALTVGYLSVGALGILLLALAGALAVFIAILVLILRQVVVILLIILAPIALVAYVLPNTQRVYKLWYDSFSKALLMFPLIVGLIAAGHIFAAITGSRSHDFIDQAIGFTAYFAPYFMIPATFKMSGGIMGALGGAVSSRASGLFGSLSQKRKANTADRIKRARNGGIYRKNFGEFNRPFKRDDDGNRVKTSLGRILNKAGDYTLDADEIVPLKLGTTTLGGRKKKPGIPGFRRGAERDLGKIEHSAHEQSIKAFQEINPSYKGGRLLGGLITGANHDYLKGLSPENQEAVIERFATGRNKDGSYIWKDGDDHTYGDRKELARIMSTSNDVEAIEAGKELGAAIPALEKYPQSADTARVSASMVGMLAAAQGGRLEIDDLVSHHNHMLKRGVSETEALHHTTQLQDVMTPKRTSAARGHGIAYRKDGTAYNVYNTDYDAATDTDRGGVESAVFSEKAANAVARISTSDLAPIKSEDLDGAMGETWVAQGTLHEASWDKVNKSVVIDRSKHKTDPLAVGRAEEIQNRFKYLASYSQGDSDVGRKLRGLWVRMGRDESELGFGTATGNHAVVTPPGTPAPPAGVVPGNPTITPPAPPKI